MKKIILILLLISLLLFSGCKASKIGTIYAKYESQKQNELELEKLFQEAIQSNNFSECNKLPPSIKIDCITKIAYTQQELEGCSFIGGGFYKDFCSIIITGNISDCDSQLLDKFSMGDINKASCRAIINQDIVECDIFKSGSTGNNMCLSWYNKIFS